MEDEPLTFAVRSILAKATGQKSEAAIAAALANLYPKPGNATERALARDLYGVFHERVEWIGDHLEGLPAKMFDLPREILHAAGQAVAMLKVRNEDAKRYFMADRIPVSDVRARWQALATSLTTLTANQKALLVEQIGSLKPDTEVAKAVGDETDINEWRRANGQTELGAIVEFPGPEASIGLIVEVAMEQAANEAGQKLAASIGFPSFTLTDQRALDWVRTYTYRLSARTAAGFESEVKAEVIKRIDDGLGGRELTKRLKEYIDPLDAKGRPKSANRIRYEADRIARTETHRAHTLGTLEAAQEAGVPYMRWVTGGVNLRTGREVCWRCAPMEGKIIETAQGLVGVQHDYPGLIPVHPNCRCRLVPVRDLPEGVRPLDDAQLTDFRQSIAESDPALHPFSTEASLVNADLRAQQKRVRRLATINRQMRRTKKGSPERAALEAERTKLRAESVEHLEAGVAAHERRREAA